MNPIVEDLAVALAIFLALLAALEAGFRFGVRRTSGDKDASASGQIGAVQGALLGLLGLLLAFSFAAAGARFLERQDLITVEANAIGTAWLRADLLNEPHKDKLRTAPKRYTEHRIEISARLRDGLSAATYSEVDRLHAAIWSAAIAGVEDRPSAMLGVLPPVNEVIDLHSTRIAEGKKQLPPLVLGLLLVSSLLSVGAIGYGCGLGGRRRAALTTPLALVIAAALWVTYDLDHPRADLMRLNDAPLQALKFD